MQWKSIPTQADFDRAAKVHATASARRRLFEHRLSIISSFLKENGVSEDFKSNNTYLQSLIREEEQASKKQDDLNAKVDDYNEKLEQFRRHERERDELQTIINQRGRS